MSQFEPSSRKAQTKLESFGSGGNGIFEILRRNLNPAQRKLKSFGTSANDVFETPCRDLSPAHEKLKQSSNRLAQAAIWFGEVLSSREFGLLKLLKVLTLTRGSARPPGTAAPSLRILAWAWSQTLAPSGLCALLLRCWGSGTPSRGC